MTTQAIEDNNHIDLPYFEEPEELDVILDYILVDWEDSLPDMIRT